MNLAQAHNVMVETHLAALRSKIRANAVEMISGPGIGKSSTVNDVCRSLARRTGQPVGLVVNMLAALQAVDLRGFMIPQKGPDGRPVTVFSLPPWMPGRGNIIVFTPDGIEHPVGTWQQDVPAIGICFLDEYQQSEDEVKKASAELLLHGTVGTDSLPVGWRVVAASNRMTDRSGVLRPLRFITNRRLELRIDANLPAWIDWVNGLPEKERPHYLTVSFAQKQPDIVFRDTMPEGDDPFCTPRSLVLMDRDLRALRSKEDEDRDRLPMDQVAREVARGWIGGNESAQYFTHIRYAEELPDLDDVVKSPMSAKLPERVDAQMVLAFMLAHNVTKTSAGSIVKYAKRLRIDMQILAFRTMRDQQDKMIHVANNREFSEWLVENKDVLLAAHA